MVAIALFLGSQKSDNSLECDNSQYTKSFQQYSTNTSAVDSAKELLSKGEYTTTGSIVYAKHAQSVLQNYLKLEDLNDIVQERLKKFSLKQKNSEQPLVIKYSVRENDKEDPNKRGGDFCRVYGGSVKIEILIGSTSVYAGYSEYLRDNGKDLPQHIDCIVGTFVK